MRNGQKHSHFALLVVKAVLQLVDQHYREGGLIEPNVAGCKVGAVPTTGRDVWTRLALFSQLEALFVRWKYSLSAGSIR